MENTPNCRYRMPEQKFYTPQDLATWSTILGTRYWNDRMQDMLDAEKAPIKPIEELEPIRPLREVKTECPSDAIVKQEPGSDFDDYPSSVKSEDCEYENRVQLIPFFEILKRPQKPNLFGNTLVSFDTTVPVEVEDDSYDAALQGTKRPFSDGYDGQPEPKRFAGM